MMVPNRHTLALSTDVALQVCIMTRTANDSDQRTSTPGVTAPFTSLDEERQASMADEGGASAALMEVDDGERARLRKSLRSRRLAIAWKLAVGFALFGAALAFVAKRYARS